MKDQTPERQTILEATREELKAVEGKRRRIHIHIEISVLVTLLCAAGGFLAGASWQWKQFADLHPASLEEPVETEVQAQTTTL